MGLIADSVSSTMASGAPPTNSGNIVQENPFGNAPDAEAAKPSSAQKGMKDASTAMSSAPHGDSHFASPAAAILGIDPTYFKPQQMQTAAPANIQLPQIQTPQMAAPIQAPIQPTVPAPMQLGAMSDIRSKQNIKIANKEMDDFLQRVYSNLIKGKK